MSEGELRKQKTKRDRKACSSQGVHSRSANSDRKSLKGRVTDGPLSAGGIALRTHTEQPGSSALRLLSLINIHFRCYTLRFGVTGGGRCTRPCDDRQPRPYVCINVLTRPLQVLMAAVPRASAAVTVPRRWQEFPPERPRSVLLPPPFRLSRT